MFVGREEPRRIIAACEDTLMMESENMRSQVRRTLGEPDRAAVSGSPNVYLAPQRGSGVGELGA